MNSIGNAIKGKDGKRHTVAKYTLSDGKDPVLGIRRLKSVTYACGATDDLPGCAHEY